MDAISPDETAFHIPAVNALEIADGAIRYGDELQFVPDESWTTPRRRRPASRAAFARLADELDFDVLLLAHGKPIPSGGREALRRFASS